MKSEGWLTHRILSNSNNLGDLAKPVHSGSSWHFCHYSFPSVTQQDTFHMRVLWTPLKGCMSDNYFGQTLHRKMKEGQRAFLATTSLSQFQSTLIRIPKHSAWLSCVWNPTCLIPRFKWPASIQLLLHYQKNDQNIYFMHQVLILMVVWQVDDSAYFLGPCHCMASFLEACRTISGMHRGCAGEVHYLGQMTHCFKNMSQIGNVLNTILFLRQVEYKYPRPQMSVFFILFFYGAYFWTGMNPIVTYTFNFVCLICILFARHRHSLDMYCHC